MIVRGVILRQHQAENVAPAGARVAKGRTKQISEEAAQSIDDGVALALVIIQTEDIVVHVHSGIHARGDHLRLSQFLISHSAFVDGHCSKKKIAPRKEQRKRKTNGTTWLNLGATLKKVRRTKIGCFWKVVQKMTKEKIQNHSDC
jgi:hypothetical protein